MPKYIKAKEFQNLPKRFIAVKQDGGRSRLQDLEGADRLMTNKEVVAQSQAIGAQNQAAIQAGRAFQDRMRRENLATGQSRYGPGFADRVKAQANKITSDVQAQQAAKRASPEYKAAIQAQAEKNVDARLNPQNVAVSQKVGFDVAGSQQRTASVLAQSERAERMADESRRKAAKVGLFRESVDYYKGRLNENILRALGRWVGPKWRATKSGARAVGNIPGVKPVARTALVAAGVAGGAYAYNKYLRPDKAQIDPQGAAGIDPKTGKKKSSGSWTAPTRIVYKRGEPTKPLNYVNPNSPEGRIESQLKSGGWGGEGTWTRNSSGRLKPGQGVHGGQLPMDREAAVQQAGDQAASKSLGFDVKGLSNSQIKDKVRKKIKSNTAETEAGLRKYDSDTKGPMPVNPMGDNEPGWELRRAEKIRQTPEYKEELKKLITKKKSSTVKANQPMSLD